MAMKFGMMFPGQGSQSVGMMAALADRYPRVAETFAEASAVLDRDLWRLVSEGPEEDLNRTEWTQPAMLAAGVATWRVWRDAGGAEPVIMAGHSLGEYTALVCADALDFATAVELVAIRGRLMQQAVAEGSGAMAAILGLEDAEVEQACAAGVVEPANFNSPGQVVVAGERRAVEEAMARAREAGARRVVLLPVSVPSHCSLMREAATALGTHLDRVDLRPPRIPVLHNCDVSTHAAAAGIRAALVTQMYRPVRWVETVQAIRDAGARGLLECGPGKVLTGLARRIDRRLPAQALIDPETLDQALQQWGSHGTAE